ncbi:MAG TPA: sulfatase-like hydrolase/transferase [Candidatus Sabulitectum sp.]|nr:sulfatase-like hydrolase/transferase [Candidatus Sabulitectum sp.]HRW77213.1 sulfatase-like hydrolase/transferase [Candidatus Sabulitectum sp.]
MCLCSLTLSSCILHKHNNVILILVDTLRPDHLGCYGYERNTSPSIDSLAESGIMFTNVIAQSSWTLPSVTSIRGRCLPAM